jgi:hypothetical protein
VSLIAMVLGVIAGPAGAASITIVNPGFETDILADGSTNTAPTGWVEGYTEPSGDAAWNDYAGGDAGAINPNAAYGYSGNAPEGTNVAFGLCYTGFDVGLRQTLSETLEADKQYDLSALVGNPYAYNSSGPAADYRLQLVANGVILAEDTANSPADDTVWTNATLTYLSGSSPAQLGLPLEIRLLVADNVNASQVNFDDVQLTVTNLSDAAITFSDLGASDITDSSATLNATLEASTTNADVCVHWGPTDGTNNPAAWTNSAYVGSWTNLASTNVSFAVGGLAADTTYFFRFRGTNATDDIWYGVSWSFATPPTGCLWIANPGFEEPAIADDTYAYSVVGWESHGVNASIGVWDIGTEYGGNAPEGENVGFQDDGAGGFAQVLPSTFQASMTYALSVVVGNNPDYTFGGYQVQLLAGGTATNGGTLLAEDSNTVTVATETFATSTVTYAYDPTHSGLLGEQLQIRLLALADVETDFDDVVLCATYVPITLIDLGVSGISSNSATFNTTLEVATTNADVWVYWGPTDGTNNPAAWSNSMYLGSWTNVASTNLSHTAAGLDATTQYYYRFRGTNDAADTWASPSGNFVTTGPEAQPAVGLGGGATNMGGGMATLRGELTAGGFADAYICWGAVDGGTVSTGGWDHCVSGGPINQGVTFSNTVSDLYYGVEYDYRVYVTNSAGKAWSDAATFTTPLPQLGGETLGWSYTNWTSDADSGITNDYIYTAAHSFGDNHAGVTVNGVPFTYSFAASGTGWSIGGGQNNWGNDDDVNVTGVSEDLAEEFVYNGNPRTVQLSGLTIGTRYKATFFSAGWEASGRFQTFLSGGESLYLDQDIFGNNNGITISYVYEATDTTQDFSITPAAGGNTFHMYALANREGAALANVGITNDGAENIGATTADLVGTLDAAQAVFNVTLYWSASNNVDAADWLGDGTASNAAIGSFTNVMGQSVSHSVSSLTSGATYYYTMLASNAATNIWADPNASFTTASAPGVDNAGGATDVFGFIANLNGELTTGGVADAYICWGTNDVGTSSTGHWQNVESIGSVLQGEPFAENLSGLMPLTTYYYSCYVTNEVADAWSAVTNFTTLDPDNTMVSATGGNDSWNTGGNWTLGHAPVGLENGIVSNGVAATVYNNSTPEYSGTLTLRDSATLMIGAGHSQNVPNSLNSLGTNTIIMNADSVITLNMKNNVTFPALVLTGNARINSTSTESHHRTHTFPTVDGGTNTLTLQGPGNNGLFKIAGNNRNPTLSSDWSGGLVVAGGNNDGIEADATGSLGTGDVTLPAGTSLRIDAADAVGDVATLSLNGPGATKAGFGGEKLRMNADDTVNLLRFDGNPYPTGTYARIGLGGVDYEFEWIAGDGILTVTNAPPDSTPPTVTFEDDQGGGPVYPGQPVTYTITFTEPVTPDPTTNDFDNAFPGEITVDSITQTSDVEYQVVVMATGTGSLQLQIVSGAAIEDLFGNALVTAVADDDTLTVQPLPRWKGELRILKPWANGGINPATGLEWAVGDQYRLAFVSSAGTQATSSVINTYNDFVQGLADAAGHGAGTWKVIGSTAAVDARDNTGTNPGADGAGVAIFLMDGGTKIADDNNDLWNNDIDAPLILDENGELRSTRIFGGSDTDGTGRGTGDPGERVLGGSSETSPKVTTGESFDAGAHWMVQYNADATTSFSVYALSDPLTIQSVVPTGTKLIVR